MTQAMIPRSKRSGYAARYAKLHRNGVDLSTDATVTQRMLQALRAIGYTRSEIAEGTGVGNARYIGNLSNASGGSGPRKSVYLKTAKRIEDFYWGHYDEPRSGTPDSSKAITHARKAGFPAPASWDDITDTSERPKGVLKA